MEEEVKVSQLPEASGMNDADLLMIIQNETNKQVNAEKISNLNSIKEHSVKVSASQPTTEEAVWVRTGKNLFNKNDVLKGCAINGSTGQLLVDPLYFASQYMEVSPNTNYYISGNKTSGSANICYDKDKNYLGYVSNVTGKITTLDNTKYLRIYGLLTELNNNLQIEQGSAATTYEPYIDKKIYIKNDNDIYEKFYAEETLTKTIWKGNLYSTNDYIDLVEPLKSNQLYIFTFYGLSTVYLMQFPFTYVSGNFQIAYYDGNNYFRMRLDITNNGRRVSINDNSINNAANTALIAIEKV